MANFRMWFAVAFLSMWATSSSANVVGTAYQIFNPTYDGQNFLTVESSRTLKAGQFNLGFTIDYAANSLPYVTNSSVDSSKSESREDSLFSGFFSLGLGITDSWDVGVTVPVAFNQVVGEGRVVENDLSEDTVSEIRLATKFRIWGDAQNGLGLIARVNFDRIEDNVFTGSDPDVGYSAELAWSAALSSKVDVAVNAGYKWNGTGDDIANQQYQILDDMILMSAAVGFAPNDKTKLFAELYRGQAQDDVAHPTDRKQDPFEGLIGLRWKPSRVMSVHAGYAREIQHSLGSADWRAFAGVNLTFGGTAKPAPIVVPKPMPLPTPEPTPVAQPVVEEKITVKDIKFANGSSQLGSDAATNEALGNIVKALKQGFTSLEVAGHSDSLGKESFNQKLSQRRAESIKARIIKLGGFDASKIKAVGYGESQPIDTNATPAGRANNRRVEFNIIK